MIDLVERLNYGAGSMEHTGIVTQPDISDHREAAAEIQRLRADLTTRTVENECLQSSLAAITRQFAELRERHSTMTVSWTRAKQDRAQLLAALEKARELADNIYNPPNKQQATRAGEIVDEIDALLSALRTAPVEPPVANGGTGK